MPSSESSPAPAESGVSTGSATPAEPGPRDRSLSGKVLTALRRGGAFLVVGAIGFVVDAGAYNLLVFWGGEGVLYNAPLAAKIIAIGVATVVTYFGNKWWTFSHKQSGNPGREYLLYAAFNVIAIALQLGCLGFSRYVLDLSSPLSDNISGTLIGQIVAVLFRYWAYDKFVFTDGPARKVAERAHGVAD